MATTKITNPELFDLGSLNTALKLPSGTTAERPTSPSTGEWRYNTTTNLVEFWDGGAWRDLQSEDIPPIPSEHFNTVLWTGNGSGQSITGAGFAPDFVWLKNRDQNNYGHRIFDTSRGALKKISPSSTAAESTDAGSVTSFDSDGFTLGNDNYVNNNGDDFVGWCFKANGGTTSSNTDGTQTSTVQVNSKAGFSIVEWTSSAAGSSETVGHGLGATPAMIFLKRTDAVEDWYVWHKDLGAGSSALNQFLKLNSTASQATATNLFNTVDSTVFNPSYTNGVPNTNIAYCFAEKAQYSKFGSYTGNGSANGPIVNTGFEPAFIMIKNSTAIYEWTIYDNKRSTSNPRDNVLYPNNNNSENNGETGDIDFLTNGFQIKAAAGTINQNGGTIIYAAFASDPSAAPVLADSFGILSYTGNSSGSYPNTSSQDITGLGFQPQHAVVKRLDGTSSWPVYDVLRGDFEYYYWNSTSANGNTANAANPGGIGALPNGIKVYDDGAGNYSTNAPGGSFIAYAWKTSILPSINTDGTIQSMVSVNQAAGMSIVKYTGDGSASSTVGHGLGVIPELTIFKSSSTSDFWHVFDTAQNTVMFLNATTGASAISGGTNGAVDIANMSSTTFGFLNGSSSVNNQNGNGTSYVVYAFKSIAGFSKIGTYTGTGSAGQAITTGFEPTWILIKSTVGNANWRLYDTTRGITAGGFLRVQGTNAQDTQDAPNLDITATGFEINANGVTQGLNANGNLYFYMAFKENPSPVVPAGQMAFLTVAGGGSGFAAWGGGGGGAGGLRTSFGSTSGGGASAESNVTLYSGTYTITVGAGGAGGTGEPEGGGGDNSNNGADSSLAGPSMTTITSTGGGGAGDVSTGATGKDGGSGGGGSAQFRNYNGPYGVSGPGGAGTANQGFDGSTADFQGGNNSYNAGGGGGGASAAGTNATFALGGSGGDGLTVSITGSATTYAGGGGGGIAGLGSAGSGGSGGGGNGSNSGTGTAGTANTGGGAGGTYRYSNTFAAGGSGIVVLRMRTSDYSGTTTGSPTVTTIGEETILTYTGSGTYVHS